MPNKPLRLCRHPGCGELTDAGYCPAHTPQRPSGGDRSDEARRWHRLYSLPQWTEDLRPTQLLREPWCEECAKRGRRTRAMDVDHVRDHKGDLAVFLDRSNLRSLCHRCHSQKTARTMRRSGGSFSEQKRG